MLAWIAMRQAINAHLDASTRSPILEVIDPIAVQLGCTDTHATMYPMGYGLSMACPERPNARVNRRLPAKLVDVLLNNQLGHQAPRDAAHCAEETGCEYVAR